MIEHIRIFPDKCTACRSCEVACIAAHHNMTFKEAMKHRDTLVSRVQIVKAEGLRTTVRCHQCESAPCCKICPTGALKQDESGRITMHDELCIACEMCVKACPYGTISMDTAECESGDPAGCEAGRPVAVRCDMCYAWRLENCKKITACMEICPKRALYLVEADGSIVEKAAPQKKPVAAKPEQSKTEGQPNPGAGAANRAPSSDAAPAEKPAPTEEPQKETV